MRRGMEPFTKNDAPTKEIKNKIKEKGGYCPCKLLKNDDTKCMCKEFREQKEGECHCGLYIKISEV